MASTEEAPKSAFQETGLNVQTQDPFAAQRDARGGPFLSNNQDEITPLTKSPIDNEKSDRKLSSDEWDASKTPPSRFQQRKGSIYATPSSRDGHVDKHADRDAAYHAKLLEKGWAGKVADKVRRGSQGGSDSPVDEK